MGENSYLRGVGATSFQAAGGDVLLAVEAEKYDGPWVLPEDLKKINAIAKFTHRGDGVDYGVEVLAYSNSWTSTDQIPQRAVDSGQIDRLGFIDPDLGGKTERYSLTGFTTFHHGDGSTTDVRAYAIDYNFDLTSNFTYFLDDPVNGDEFRQEDRRWIYGGKLTHSRDLGLFGRTAKLRVGLDTRFDDIRKVGIFNSVAGEVGDPILQDAVQELSVSGFAEIEVPLTDRLRATIGAREDYYHADIDAAGLPANGGSSNDTLFSPSAALAYRATDELEFYANYGRGLHSNDVRGTTITIDPVSGDPADRVPLLVKSQGAELGARFERGKFNATLSAFWLELDGELVFVGDAGTTEANNPSRRYGVELASFREATDWLVLDASAAYTDAKFRDVDPGFDRIPGAVKTVVSAGAVARWGNFTTTIRVRHFGEAPLIEDNSVTSDPTTLVNFGASYDLGRFQIKLDVFNLLDSHSNDITYFYASRLRSEAAPVDDYHFHPVEPGQIRLSLRARL